MSFLRLAVGAPRRIHCPAIGPTRWIGGRVATSQYAGRRTSPAVSGRPPAQTVWDMPTEYPENAMPGVGLDGLRKTCRRNQCAGKLEIRPSFDAKAGIRSAGMLAAIAEGRVQAGDAFAGALEAEDPIFALPSLPFLVTSTADAKRLADIARPHLAAALQKKGLRLLYLTPWPPSGIWSKTPLKSPPDLAGLSIRTYDKTSTEVFCKRRRQGRIDQFRGHDAETGRRQHQRGVVVRRRRRRPQALGVSALLQRNHLFAAAFDRERQSGGL